MASRNVPVDCTNTGRNFMMLKDNTLEATASKNLLVLLGLRYDSCCVYHKSANTRDVYCAIFVI